MSRDSITLASLLPAGCNTAEQYVTSIITEARTREGRTLEGWTFDPTEATLCMMKATKAVNDAWDEVPIDDPTANDDDAYIIALDRAFRSIVADRDRIRTSTTEEPTAIEQPNTEEPTIEEPTAEELPAVELPTDEEPTIDEQPAIEVPAPALTAPAPAPSIPTPEPCTVNPEPSPRPYQPSDLDDPDCTIMIDGQTYRDADGDYHHINSDETLYVSIPQNLEGVTSAELAGDDHEVLRVAMEQHGCKPIDTPNALLRILKDYGLVHTLHEVTDDEPTEESSNHEPLTVNPEPSTTIEEQPTAPIDEPAIEQPSQPAAPAPVLTAPAPAPSNDLKAPAADVQRVLATMPDLATSTAVAIRKAAPNFKLMFSIDAVANARTIEWSMPDPTHVTLTATEEDGTIWSQREDVKNGGRRVTVTEADGTCTQFKSVGKLIAYLNGQCSLDDAIKSTKKAKPAAIEQPTIEQPAATEEPAATEPTIEQPAIDEPVSPSQPSMAAEEPKADEPTIDEPIDEPTIEEPAAIEPTIEQPAIDEPVSPSQPSMAAEEPKADEPTPKAAATAEPMRGKPLPSFHHPKFDDILTLSKAGFAIYMYGPAGTGKSTIVKQCAKAMGLEYTTISSPTMEHKVEGFIDAKGIFRSTQFRDAFEHGKVFDMAEIDNIPSEVLVIMNDALSDGCFAFPDGLVYMHPNFRCFASGNTAGKGADGAYTARKILDAASLDRFELIRIDYDEQVEINIATDDETGNVDTDALEFVHDFRRVMADSQPNFVVSYRRLKSLLGMVKCFKGDYEKAVRYAIVRELADQKDDLRNIVMSLQPNSNNPYYCALRTIVQRLFGKGRKPVAA